MSEQEVVFAGKEKMVYGTDDPQLVRMRYSDLTTAFHGIKKAILKGKGISANKISAIVFGHLAEAGIPVHFVKLLSDREQLCRRVENIPLQIVVRNRIVGTTARLLGLEQGTEIANTIFELRYNCDELCDPLINDHHAVALGLASYADLGYMYDLARKADEVMTGLFAKAGIELVDFKMEFGRDADGEIIICDELSPDNCRLWETGSGRCLDKDRFRHDMSDVCASYKEVLDRLIKATEK